MTAPRGQGWGKGLLIAFSVFVAAVLAVVAIAVTQRVDLSVDNYYERGLNYEERLAAMRRASESGFVVVEEPARLRLQFSRVYPPRAYTGTIRLYRPSDERDDLHVPVSLDTASTQIVPVQGLPEGRWTLQVEWEVGGELHYMERRLTLP
jgi:nitrogen fixation protein FixH